MDISEPTLLSTENFKKAKGTENIKFKFSIAFCNISGFKSLFKLMNDEINLFNNNLVICLAETWLLNNQFQLPFFFSDYIPFVSLAVKTNVRGRASGGLLTLVKKQFEHHTEVIDRKDYWLFIGILIEHTFIIIGNIYLPPLCDIELQLELLNNTIIKIKSKYPNSNMVLLGDFNCRIGNLNSFDDDIFDNFQLIGARTSSDIVINRRGKLLSETMETLGFYLCNGRSLSDSPGKFTNITARGKSTIDLVWINENMFNLFCDLSVDLISESYDHLLCYVPVL